MKKKKSSHLDHIPNLPHTELEPRYQWMSLKPILSLIPRRTKPNSDPPPITVESNSRHAPLELWVLPQSFLDLVIPDRHRRIRTCRSESVERGMGSEGIDRPDVVHVVDGLSMAFESVFLFLSGWGRVEILYGDSTFYRSSCVSYSL